MVTPGTPTVRGWMAWWTATWTLWSQVPSSCSSHLTIALSCSHPGRTNLLQQGAPVCSGWRHQVQQWGGVHRHPPYHRWRGHWLCGDQASLGANEQTTNLCCFGEKMIKVETLYSVLETWDFSSNNSQLKKKTDKVRTVSKATISVYVTLIELILEYLLSLFIISIYRLV